MSRRTARGAVLAAIVLAGALLAPAVAPAQQCPERETTPEEREWSRATLAAMREALPAAPAGWKVVRETRVEPVLKACAGMPLTTLAFTRRLAPDPQGQRERQAEHARRMAEAQRLSPDEEARVKELDRRLAELRPKHLQARRAAANPRLDPAQRAEAQAEEQRLLGEIRPLEAARQAAAKPWLADESRKQAWEKATREADERLFADAEAELSAFARADLLPAVAMPAGAEPLQVPGAALAYRDRGPGPGGGVPQERVRALIGPWPRAGAAATEPPKSAASPGAPRLLGIDLWIWATNAERAASLLKATDVEALRALVR